MWPRAQKSGRLQQLAGPGNGVSPPGPPGGRGPAGSSLSAPRGRPRTSAFRNRRVTNVCCGKSELAAQAQSSAGARSGCSPRRHLLGRSWHLTDRKTGPLEGRVRGVGWARRPFPKSPLSVTASAADGLLQTLSLQGLEGSGRLPQPVRAGISPDPGLPTAKRHPHF